jgi:hypothetical protein
MMMRQGILVNARNRHCDPTGRRNAPSYAGSATQSCCNQARTGLHLLLRFPQWRQFYSPIGARHEKKPGSQEPGLRYWPREADTITFQEG